MPDRILFVFDWVSESNIFKSNCRWLLQTRWSLDPPLTIGVIRKRRLDYELRNAMHHILLGHCILVWFTRDCVANWQFRDWVVWHSTHTRQKVHLWCQQRIDLYYFLSSSRLKFIFDGWGALLLVFGSRWTIDSNSFYFY